ncbi:MAG: transcription elongation factor GreA [Nitrospinae bacterium]|nr:transcription elongation factor GreA [Nitrospinota bacterium]
MDAKRTNYLTRASREKQELRFQEIQKEKSGVADEIRVAKAHGDLRENAEYHAALEKQRNLSAEEGRVHSFLSDSVIIDDIDYSEDSSVRVGKKVTLLNLDTDEEIEYQILGELEADPKNNIISVYTPLSRSLLGKEEGDVVRISPPRKPSYEVEIVEVESIYS